MKPVSRIVLVGLFSFSVFVGFHAESVFATTTISVTSYGAQCNGVTDDTSAIQASLDAAAAAGGGTVILPNSTCLLNSFAPSSHPWIFYNLHVPSGVTLQGGSGSMLLQGPRGRQSIGNVAGAIWIENTVVAVGNDYATVKFQSSSNGGFYNLQAMIAGSPSVRLTTVAQAAYFAVGDYVAIYEYTRGDVLPAQMSQVTGVNAASGDLTLADAVIRPFAAPSIAKVSSLAAHDIAINNVIIQGAVPLAITETFNFSASNDQFLSDTSIGGGNIYELELNTVEHFSFAGSTITAINGGYIPQELCQRDSQNGVWTGNTFQDTAVGFGEYAANITMTNNHIYLHPNGTFPDGVSLGGMNVQFSGNDVHTIGNQNNSSGWGFIVADVYAPSSYYAYTGNIQITNNTIQCVADGNNCLLLVGYGTLVSGNTITAAGSATGVYGDAFANVTNNTIQIGSGTGIVLRRSVLGRNGGGAGNVREYFHRVGMEDPYSTVAGNTLSGTGRFGIFLASLPALIYGNVITGFATPISTDPH